MPAVQEEHPAYLQPYLEWQQPYSCTDKHMRAQQTHYLGSNDNIYTPHTWTEENWKELWTLEDWQRTKKTASLLWLGLNIFVSVLE